MKLRQVEHKGVLELLFGKMVAMVLEMVVETYVEIIQKKLQCRLTKLSNIFVFVFRGNLVITSQG